MNQRCAHMHVCWVSRLVCVLSDYAIRYCTCMQMRWMQPFLKIEADTLLGAGYQDLGWREVSSEAFGEPNPKRHVVLVATARQCGVVDSCLFSTVGSRVLMLMCLYVLVFICVYKSQRAMMLGVMLFSTPKY